MSRGDYTGTAKEVIRNTSVDKLTIRTTGNKLTNTLSGSIAVYKDTIIEGSNTDWGLALNNGGYNAIAVWNGADLTLMNVTLKISNSRFGINGREPAQKSSLSLNSAAAYISSTEGAVVNFGKKLNIIDNATKEATYDEQGTETCTCSRCGAEDTNDIPKLKKSDDDPDDPKEGDDPNAKDDPKQGEDPDETILLGDVNNDGKIKAADITKIAAHIKGLKTLDEGQKKRADVNIDSKINAVDITKIAAHIKGIKKLA